MYGDNGILNQAVESSIATENATVYEQLQLKVVDYQLEDVTDNIEEDVLERLKEDGYVNSDNTVNVDALIPNNDLKRGKGSLETGDVYVLELGEELASLGKTASTYTVTLSETDGMITALYYLVYYNENNEYNNLGSVFDTTYYDPTDESYFDYDPETGGIGLKDSGSYYDANDGNDGNDGNFIGRELGLDTIVVPSTYNGQTVTKIGRKFIFNENSHSTVTMGINATDVRKIILPNTITELVDGYPVGAFRGCTNLEEIVLSNSLQYIGSYAFTDCTALSAIDIPDTVTTIGYRAFENCTSIETLVIPESVTSVGSQAFYGWTAEQTIYVPFSEDNIPDGWEKAEVYPGQSWNYGCNATIIYAD